MIRFIFIQNVLGKTRMAKYYVPYEDAEKHKIEHDIHRIVASRDQKFTNFVEVSRPRAGARLGLPPRDAGPERGEVST